jgi:hypothetical protein
MPDLSATSSHDGAPTPQSDAALQHALADAVAAYGKRVREHGELRPFPVDPEGPAPTDVALTTAAMLKAAEITSFEIAALFNI